jgi:hypothetical protein
VHLNVKQASEISQEWKGIQALLVTCVVVLLLMALYDSFAVVCAADSQQ